MTIDGFTFSLQRFVQLCILGIGGIAGIAYLWWLARKRLAIIDESSKRFDWSAPAVSHRGMAIIVVVSVVAFLSFQRYSVMLHRSQEAWRQMVTLWRW